MQTISGEQEEERKLAGNGNLLRLFVEFKQLYDQNACQNIISQLIS